MPRNPTDASPSSAAPRPRGGAAPLLLLVVARGATLGASLAVKSSAPFELGSPLQTSSSSSRSGSPAPPLPARYWCWLWFTPPERVRGLFAVHIPKTAVCSIVKDVRAIPGAPPISSSETCWLAPRGAEYPNVESTLVMLREPRAHVLSQYMECSSSHDWAANEKNLENTRTHLPSFPDWVHTWAERRRNGSAASSLDYAHDELGCYRPVDFQCHVMTCTNKFEYTETAKAELAIEHMHMTDYVGIVEKYQESLCLFHAKMAGTLPHYCDCKNETAWGSFSPTDVKHGVAPHSVDDFSAAVLEEIDYITQGDQLLYKAGLERLRNELREVEQRFAVQVMCE